MGKEEILANFSITVLRLAKISYFIKDRFFYNKFSTKIKKLNKNFLNFIIQHEKGHVAQYNLSMQACLDDIDAILDIFKELEYLKIIKPSPLFLKAERGLLGIKLNILERGKKVKLTFEKPKEVKEKVIINEPDNKISLEKIKKNIKLTESKKKILDYIKLYPNARTKDIIYEFSSLSGRTVKRNLTDLIQAGLVKKRVDNKAVYYYADEIHNPGL